MSTTITRPPTDRRTAVAEDRGDRVSLWLRIIVLAAAVMVAVALIGRAIVGDGTEKAEPSLHNLREGIDDSFTGNRPLPPETPLTGPSQYKLYPGIDAAAGFVAADPGFAPHFLEGIDASLAVTMDPGYAPHYLEGIDATYVGASAATAIDLRFAPHWEEAIDASFTGAVTVQPAKVSRPSLYKLHPGLDAGFAGSVAVGATGLRMALHWSEGIDASFAGAAAASSPDPGFAPHWRERVDVSYAGALPTAGPSAYTILKLEQARGEAQGSDAVSEFDRPNLVEGI